MKFTYSILIVALFGLLSSCTSPDLSTPEGFAKEFILTLKDNDIDGYLKLAPTFKDVLKIQKAESGTELSQSEIKEGKKGFDTEFVDPLKEGFKQQRDFQKDLDWKSVEFTEVLTKPEELQIGSDMESLGLLIIFKDKNKAYQAGLVYIVKIEDKWRLIKTQGLILESK